ncbi:MAG: polymer-forming cytoskeletal protein [Cyclobacteriaceae bacterium]|nr:polymer-forming cytoskeletal protein [Cyclobacteriaceae bacterium]MCH8515613.1 polymer-forming cytoskeletal protein [Cyclobacteriaceae bacterium]
MFNKQEKKVEEELSNSSNIIGKGTYFEGNIETFGNLRVEGKVFGDIKSKSKVVLGQSSQVEGNIHAQNAEISGELKGTIQTTELLVLKPSAKIYGDIVTQKLIIESGASFDGTCKMGETVKEIKLNNQSKVLGSDKGAGSQKQKEFKAV